MAARGYLSVVRRSTPEIFSVDSYSGTLSLECAGPSWRDFLSPAINPPPPSVIWDEPAKWGFTEGFGADARASIVKLREMCLSPARY